MQDEQRKYNDPYLGKLELYRSQQELSKRLSDRGSDSDVENYIKSMKEIMSMSTEVISKLDVASKDYTKISETLKSLDTINKKMLLENDAKDTMKNIQESKKLIDKLEKILGKDMVDKIYSSLSKGAGELLKTADEYDQIMNKSSQDLKQAFTSINNETRKLFRDISNTINLSKLTGGDGLSGLRDTQTQVQRTLGVSSSGFTTFQSSLISQNRELNSLVGEGVFGFKDTLNVLKEIKGLGIKNSQSLVDNYKALVVSNKYLGISSNTMQKLVDAQKANGDQNYMQNQATILAALQTDSSQTTDTEGISSFLSNIEESRYANFGKDTDYQSNIASILQSAKANFGSNASSTISSFLSDVSTLDYGELNSKYGALLGSNSALKNKIYSGLQSGSLDETGVVDEFIKAIYSAGNKTDATMRDTFFSSLGLDAQGAKALYSQYGNYSSYSSGVQNNLNTISGVKDFDTAVDLLATTSDTQTSVEKLYNTISDWMGTADWSKLLGLVQAGNALLTTGNLITNVISTVKLFEANRHLAVIASKTAFSGSGANVSNGKGSLKGLLGATAGLTSAGMFVGDLSEGGVEQALTGSNPIENALKYGLSGAAIGSAIPGLGTVAGGVGGLLIGLATGLLGAIRDNTKATEDNTDETVTTYDITRSSMIGSLSGQGGPSMGVGGSGNYNASTDIGTGYPWAVSSGYGKRHTYVNGQETNEWGWHDGFDFIKGSGTPLGANIDGKVIKKWNNDVNIGNAIRMLGNDGMVYDYYHMLKSSSLNEGDSVSSGDTVGFMGSTGNSTGPHVHFRVGKPNGADVYPASYVKSGLFSANGDTYTSSEKNNSNATEPTMTESSIAYLSKSEALSAGVGGPVGSVTSGSQQQSEFATSADIDRLIAAISSMYQTEMDEKSFMQALSGKNSTVLVR